jgi:hypothetical protein
MSLRRTLSVFRTPEQALVLFVCASVLGDVFGRMKKLVVIRDLWRSRDLRDGVEAQLV